MLLPLPSRRPASPLQDLSLRELEVLGLMAEGRSNAQITAVLVLSDRTVESHVRSIYRKLGLLEDGTRHRRVAAVLVYLEATGADVDPGAVRRRPAYRPGPCRTRISPRSSSCATSC